MKDKYQIIIRPHITEKSTLLREDNKYSFVVSRDATKPEIRRAAEELFDIKGSIIDVHTMQSTGKSQGKNEPLSTRKTSTLEKGYYHRRRRNKDISVFESI